MTLYERSAVIPGRVMTRSKAIFGAWTYGYARGAEIADKDNNLYIDMLCALGAVSLGYGRDDEWYTERGVMTLPHELEIEAAEAVLKHVAPWASRVRFTVTGSEACHAAYRIAKKATGRPIVVQGDWAYHGWHEWCDDSSIKFSHGENPDRIARIARDVSGDGARTKDIAAVFIEPHRWEPVDPEWLRSVRAFCDRIGALLVFDEMIWGGRFALGGCTEVHGVIPDLACYGKAFGNGQPVAFVVGNQALADHGTLVSGTYSGYPQGMQAVVDTIHTYTTEPVIETLWARGRQLQEGLRAVVPADLGVCEGAPVHQRIRFFNEAHGPKFTELMKARGILWHHACANVMYAHTIEQIDRAIQAAAESLRCL